MEGGPRTVVVLEVEEVEMEQVEVVEVEEMVGVVQVMVLVAVHLEESPAKVCARERPERV